MCLNLGCARERSSVLMSGLRGRVWPYSPGRVDRVDPVDPRLPRVYSGPQVGRYDETGTASAAVRCSASKLKYQGSSVGPGPGLSGRVPGGAVPYRPGGAVPQVPGVEVPQVPGGGVPKVPGGAEVVSADTRKS